MSKLICFSAVLILSLLIACKKTPSLPANNNQINATVTLPSGTTVVISASNTKAGMGCGFFGGTHIDATDASGAAVYMTSYATGFGCQTAPGTYPFTCSYRTNATVTNTPIYDNTLASPASRGSITFTTLNANSYEGSFNAYCRCASMGCSSTDSVYVSGTFKGDYFN